MATDLWFAFVLAAGVLLLLPGPTVLLIVGFALANGTRAALAAMVGVLLADALAFSVCGFGLGVVLLASAELFTVLKWAGAAYLVYLGIRQWRARAVPIRVEAAGRGPVGRLVARAFLVTVLNPKSLVFFTAFLPQFIDTRLPVGGQMLVLGATFLSLVAIVVGGYAVLAGGVRGLVSRESTARLINRIGGTALIGAGLMTALMRRNA
jgi:threonine/homoserine/homoserine lactone efflux protein